jgi:predicted CXXCH cytochrome family protein
MKGSWRLRAPILAAALALGLLAAGAIAYASPSAQKPIPHPVQGREACLACHAAGGVKPVPATHAGRTDEMCVLCHVAGAAATPTVPAAATALPGAQPAPTKAASSAPTVVPDRNAACLSCHSNPALTVNLGDGKPLGLFVDSKVLASSVHGKVNLACTDCHVGITGYPHPALTAKDARDYALIAYELCQKCHPANFTKTQDSVHATVLKASNRFAPVCTDCHGAHDVVSPAKPKTLITSTCAKCHQPIYDTYKQSVHGHALIDENNQDVPTCIDCHGVHQIPDPRTALFRQESPEVCARCHTDETLMSKYNISTKVYSTYTENFHGTTVEFYKTKWTTIWCYKAVCTDCHGIHDIRITSDPASSVNAKNLLTTCRKCHPDAPPNFTTAWTGHNQPSLDRVAPVYYVDLFYRILIPLVVGGMLAYVLLDVIRSFLDRRVAAKARTAKEVKTRGGRSE